ncbi:MAG: VOC family protein [Caulobacteraceae bacterium]
MDINHLNLRVADAERAARFYERFFGLRRSAAHGEVLFLRDGAGMDLALAPGGAGASPPSWFHFGFRLASPGEVETLHASLTEAAVPLPAPLSREEDFVWFRCADPDGYTIEVYWEPEPS